MIMKTRTECIEQLRAGNWKSHWNAGDCTVLPSGWFWVRAYGRHPHFDTLEHKGREPCVPITYWDVYPEERVVRAEPAQVQPTPDQLVTAARFDTAADRIPAHEFLEKGVGHMKDRASQRDAEDGERSMKRCVEAFNALEGTNLTETQGWKFMVMLKMARSVSGDFTADDYEDMAAYAGLAGESASMENQTSE
ncbi:hypothetical protein SIPHO075v1_p0068 [Vibrio phage PS65A.1]|nr:hypothetical protein SIPHO075v1_p0068 [Vibrio phage PS65A.1]